MARVECPSTQKRGRIYVCVSILLRNSLEALAFRTGPYMPQKSYDFQAPMGEYGLEGPSLRLLKNWNYFLNDFGSLLAPMAVFAPDTVASGPTDPNVLRWSVRTDGRAGFLFANNYVRGGVMPARPQTQFTVLLPGGRKVQLPDKPVDIPTGAYFAWPFGLDLGGVQLRYGTAQLMARLSSNEGPSFVFRCVPGVRCEVALEGDGLAVRLRVAFKWRGARERRL